VADQLRARSVAFPAIATGVYGFPARQAAGIAVTTIRATPCNVILVRLVAFDQPAYELLAAALEQSPNHDRPTAHPRARSANARLCRESHDHAPPDPSGIL
jgi:hypothetical protein